MEVQKKKNIIIIFLAFLILLIIGVLFFLSKDKNVVESNYNVIEQNGNNVIDNSDYLLVDKNEDKVLISSNSLNEDVLNDLLTIIGIEKDNKNVNNCLNVTLSNNNYKEKKREIFSWYASMNVLNTYRYNEDKCKASNECKLAYSCGACSSILKGDAHKILNLYNFNINDIDFLNDLPAYDTDYSYSTVNCCGYECPYYISHNLSVISEDLSNVIVIDTQVVKQYDRNNIDNIVNTINQVVTYEFKTYSDGSYYLNNVTVDKNQDLIGQYEGNDPWGNSLIVILKSTNENTLNWSISNKYYEQELSSNLNDNVAAFNIKGNSEKSGMNVDFNYNGVLTLNDESITIKFENGQITSGGGFMMAGALEESAKTVVLKKVK